ncbi:phosphatase PAP2 family protein [Owenweeksia hongkongensis]|uniref:phosphatase PAP2 family protein n=1 Tax=Owenweeksia hongkongensis TaxID=253245 RepID=UPI003A94318A
MINYLQKCFLLTILLLFGWVKTAISQSERSIKSQKSYLELPVETFNDTKRILLSPAKWKGKDWALAAGAVSLTALSFTVDDEIQEWSQQNFSTTGDAVAKYIGEPFGNPIIVVGGSFVIYTVAKISHHPNVSDPALTAFKATLIAGGATGLIKILAHRARPDENIPPDSWNWGGPSFSMDNLSFVSGHSATAFALAASMSTYYKDHRWVAWVTYPLATVTALSRVYDNRHWFSDVVGGAVLGIFIGKTVAMPDKYKWGIAPNSKGGTSMSFTYSF